MAIPSLNLTLTPWEYYILLALTNKTLHGYGIRNQVAHDSNGSVIIPSGTLYPALHRLDQKGLIHRIEAESRGKPVYRYQLTRVGKYRLNDEISRLETATAHAHFKLGHKLSANGWLV